MVWHELTGHLEVLWASLIALGIVVLLTPAVGGMARLLGVVDRPENGRRQTPHAASRGSAGSRSSSGSSSRRSRSSTWTARCAGSCSAPPSRRPSGRSTTSAASARGRSSPARSSPPAIVVSFGVWVHRFTFPLLGVQTLPEGGRVRADVVGIVAVMNMVNFLDGLDGLAAGVCAISAFSFCVIDLARGDINAAILTAAVLGGCIGFLRHNFYPARIFMGDSGALLLGFTLAAVSVQGLSKTAALAALVLPLLVLAVPLIDTSFVVAKRIKSRPADLRRRQRHLHHRFENIGFSQRRSVIYLYLWCATLALAALATKFVHPHPRRRLEPPGASRSTRRSACSRSAPRSTSSTCSRSSSSRTRSSGAVRRRRARRLERRHSRLATVETKSARSRSTAPDSAVTNSRPLRQRSAMLAPDGAVLAASLSPCRGGRSARRDHGVLHRDRHAPRLDRREPQGRADRRRSVGIPAGIGGVYLRYHEYFA